MSAENSRLTRAIQRIAREDPDLRRAIDATKPRGGQPGGVGVGESDGERDRICCDGSTSGSTNPGTSERDTSEGGQGGLDPSDPANLDSGPGELTGVVDCATGQPICFEGDDFIPPEGWDDPGAPPVDGTWQEGYYWEDVDNFTGVAYRASTPSGAVGARVAATNPLICVDSVYVLEVNSQGVPIRYGADFVNCSTGVGAGFAQAIGRRACSGSAESYCTEVPTDEEWPSDGCVSLATIGGSIVGSKYDPENDGSYSAPRDEIELCDPETGDSILIRPSSSGGWKSIKSLEGDIDPDTQSGYLYDTATGKRIRQISPSEFRDNTV